MQKSNKQQLFEELLGNLNKLETRKLGLVQTTLEELKQYNPLMYRRLKKLMEIDTAKFNQFKDTEINLVLNGTTNILKVFTPNGEMIGETRVIEFCNPKFLSYLIDKVEPISKLKNKALERKVLFDHIGGSIGYLKTVNSADNYEVWQRAGTQLRNKILELTEQKTTISDDGKNKITFIEEMEVIFNLVLATHYGGRAFELYLYNDNGPKEFGNPDAILPFHKVDNEVIYYLLSQLG